MDYRISGNLYTSLTVFTSIPPIPSCIGKSKSISNLSPILMQSLKVIFLFVFSDEIFIANSKIFLDGFDSFNVSSPIISVIRLLIPNACNVFLPCSTGLFVTQIK